MRVLQPLVAEVRPAQLCALAAIVALQTECSAPVRPDPVAQSERIAVAGARFDPEYDFESLSGFGAGAKGAEEAIRYCSLNVGAGSVDPLSMAVGMLYALVCLPVAASIGTAVGRSKAPSEVQFTNARSAAKYALAELKLQEAIVAATVSYGNEFDRNLTALPRDSWPASAKDASSYVAVKDSFDTVIEISVLNVKAALTGQKDLPVQLSLGSRVRVIRASDSVQLDTFQVSYDGVAHPIEEWLAGGGKGVQEELERGVRVMAEQAMDEVLLIYRLPAPRPAPKSPPAESAPLEPQESVPPYALRAIEPPVTTGRDAQLPYRLVDLQPMFRWEAFPRGLGIAPGPGPAQANDIRYDFRIYGLPTHDLPATYEGIVYERRGLEAPSHRLEQLLQPCRTYSWTVRARFILNGLGYMTEWTGVYTTPSLWPTTGSAEPWWWRRGAAPPLSARPPSSPAASHVELLYPIIMTPAAERGQQCPK